VEKKRVLDQRTAERAGILIGFMRGSHLRELQTEIDGTARLSRCESKPLYSLSIIYAVSCFLPPLEFVLFREGCRRKASMGFADAREL
jgi:hypothetical protein